MESHTCAGWEQRQQSAAILLGFLKSNYKNYLPYTFNLIFLSASSVFSVEKNKKKSHAWFGVCALDIDLHTFIMYEGEIAEYACIGKH